eukprot:s5045_g3.t5
MDDWAGRIDGFSVADLASVVERACVEATVDASAGRLRGGDSRLPEWGDRQRMSMQHLAKACEDFVPAAMADQSFFTSDIVLKDIGGLTDVKQELMDMLTMPTRYAVLLDRAPVRTRKGLMLVGPPGCGKTMLIQAAASETKGLLRFLSVKGPELLSKYIGESEAGVRKVFEQAAAAAPAVIFFDEIEALAPKRGADSTGVTDRVVNQMLCYLDGVEDRGRVFVVAATGRPDMVDPALMRPGRFDKICYCGLPSDSERLAICEILARKNNLVPEQSHSPPTQGTSLTQLYASFLLCAAPLARDLNDSIPRLLKHFVAHRRDMSPKKRPSWADQGPSSSSQSRVSTDSQVSAVSGASASGVHVETSEVVASHDVEKQAVTRTPNAEGQRLGFNQLWTCAQIQKVCDDCGRSLLEMPAPPDINLSRREWNIQFGAWKQRQRRLSLGKGSSKGQKGKHGKKGKKSRNGQSK